MIFRKPYAFIIKHFRFINILMFLCIAATIFYANGVRELVSILHNSGTLTYYDSVSYIHNEVYVFLGIGLVMSLILFYLFREKKKPTGLYLFYMISCIGEIVGFVFLYSEVSYISQNIITIPRLNMIRDISLIMYILLVVMGILSFIRGIGFDIKRFNFSKDLQELMIVDKDSEEFELLIGRNNYVYARNIRRYLREMKYYYFENRLAIISFAVLFASIGVLFCVNNYLKYSKSVSGTVITYVNGINYSINKSYVTSYNFNGEVIKKDYKYVVVDMSFYNSFVNSQIVDTNLITLKINGLVFYPNLKIKNDFSDLGLVYSSGEKISSQSSINRLIVFEVPASMNIINPIIRVQYSIDSSKKNLLVRYNNYEISPLILDKQHTERNIVLNQEVSVDSSFENNVNFTINQYKFADYYDNKYVLCKKNDECSVVSSLITPKNNSLYSMLIIDYSGVINEESTFNAVFNSLDKVFESTMSAEYSIYNRVVKTDISFVYQDRNLDKLFIQIDRKVLNGDKFYLIFSFRNQKYKLELNIK